MVAIVSGNELGLINNPLTPRGDANAGRPGLASDQVYINAATGNLVIQHQDEHVSALGPDVSIIRTYNAQGGFDGDNNDNWRIGVYRSLHSLTGQTNTTGSTITKVYGDGAEAVFTYDVSRGLYVSTVGDGAHDTLTFANNEWAWSDGTPEVAEIYDSVGKLLSMRDADGNVTQYTYTNGLITAIADASGQTTYLDYTGTNLTGIRVVSQGVTQTLTYYAYDNYNRLTYVVVDYTPEDNTLTDRTPYITQYAYDDSNGPSNRVSSITHPGGITISFTYEDVAGQYRVKTYTDGEGNTTTFNYVTVVATQTDVTNTLGQVTSYITDADGRLESVVSPQLADGTRPSTAYQYDADGNLISLTDADGHVTELAYDANGNLLRRRDGAGDTMEYTYDTENRLIAGTVYRTPDPDGSGPQLPSDPLTTHYVYDADSHLRFLISPEGRVTEHRYANNGVRLTTIRYTSAIYAVGATPPSEAELQTWAADPAHDRTNDQRTDYQYDFRSNLTSATTYASLDSAGVGMAGNRSITRYVYDQRGRLLKTIDARGEGTSDPNDYTTTYVYDGLGRVIATSRWIESPNGTAVTRDTLTTYDDANRSATTLDVANQLTTTRSYDRRGRLLHVEASSAAGTLGTTTYQYDGAGRLRLATDALGQQTHTLYDATGRIGATIDATGAVTERVYDGVGNVIREIHYANRIDLALLIDAQGEPADVTLDTPGIRPVADSANDRITRRVYDGANRLVFVIEPYSTAAGAVTENRYDGLGRLTDVIAYINPINLATFANATAPDAVTALLAPSGAQDRHSRTFYDGDGNRIGTLDGEGYLCEYTYDAAGRLRQTVHYGNAATIFTSPGVIDTAASDALRAAGTFAALKQAVSDQGVSPDDRHDYTFYNGKGQVIGRLDAEGYLTESYYDVAGNLSIEGRYSLNANPYDGSATSASALAQLRPTGDPDVHFTIRLYNGANQLTQLMQYPEQTTTRYTYDAAGRLLQTERAADTEEVRSVRMRYDAKGRVIQELSGEGSAALAALIDPTPAAIEAIWDQYSTKYDYDLAGRQVATTDANGLRTLFYYDALDRLRYTVNAAGEVSETRYTVFGDVSDTFAYTNRISLTGLTGGTIDTLLSDRLAAAAASTGNGADAHTHFDYTVRGLVQREIIAPDNAALMCTTLHAQNAFGEETATLSLGSTNQLRYDHFSYDRRGERVQTTADSLGGGVNRTTLTHYDAFGRITEQTDPNGTTRTYTYDRLGRQLTSATTDSAPALNLTTATSYDAFDRVLTQTDARGKITTYVYDDANRTFTLTTPEGIATVTHLDRHGETVEVELIDPDGETVRHTFDGYDANGRAVMHMTMLADTSLVSETSYDPGGRKILTRDANGAYVQFVYDQANRLMQRIVDPTTLSTPNDNPNGLNLTTSYAYDGQGRTLLTVEGLGSPAQRATKTTYNARGEVAEVIVDPTSIFSANDNPNGLNLRTTYTYDPAGRTATVTEAAGTPAARTTRYAYDNLGRRIQEIKDDGGLNITCNYVYDKNDNLILKTEAAGTPAARTTRYVYDGANRLRYTVDALGYVDERVLDANGNTVAQVRYADPLPAAVLTTIRATNPNVDAYTPIENAFDLAASEEHAMLSVYDADNRMRFRIDGPGYVTETRYDGAGQVSETIRYANPLDLTALLRDAGYTDAQIDALSARELRAALIPLLTVDDLDARIVFDDDVDRHTAYEYDGAGRLMSTTDAEGYSEQNAYDGVGNRIAFTNKKHDTWTYEYDAAGRLITETTPPVEVTRVDPNTLEATTTTEPVVTRMTYDALGNVTLRTEADGTNDARTTTYVYDALGRQIQTLFPNVASYDAGADQAANYLGPHNADTTPTSTTYYDPLGRAVASRDVRGNVSYKVYDALGRVRYEIDAERYVTEYTYDAFDNQLTLKRYAAALDEANFTAREQAAANSTAIAAFTEGEVQALLTDIADPMQDRIQTTTYDALDRAVEVTQTEVFNYDSTDQLGFNAAPTTRNTYDGFGQLIQQSSFKNPGADQQIGTADDVWLDTYFYYNARGEKTAQIDPLGYLTTYGYDSVGNLIAQTEYATALTYTANATPQSGEFNASAYRAISLAPSGVGSQSAIGFDRTMRYTYDGMNRKQSETQAHVKYYSSTASGLSGFLGDVTTRYAYDAVGNLTSVTDPSGATTFTYYDALGRTTAVAEPTRTSESLQQAAVLSPLSIVAPFGVTLSGAGNVTLGWPSLDQWGPGDVKVQLDYTHKGGLHRTTSIRTFSATDALTGVSFTVEKHGVQHIDHVYLWKVVDGEDVLLFDGPGNSTAPAALAWAKSPIAGMRVTLEYRLAGSSDPWTTVTTDAGGGIEVRGSRYWVDISTLADDAYEYKLSYSRDGEPYASGVGTFVVDFAASGSGSPANPTIQEGALALNLVGTTSAHFQYSGSIRTPPVWVGNGSVTLAWNAIDRWGSGDVRVQVDYRAIHEDRSQVDTDSGVRTFTGSSARTGVTLDLGAVGVESVDRIRVWKVVDGQDVLLVDATGDRYEAKLFVAPLAPSAHTVTLEYRRRGTTGPYQSKDLAALTTSTGVLSGWFAANYDDIENGIYEYRLTVKDDTGAAVDLTSQGGNAQGQLVGTLAITRGGQSLPAVTTNGPTVQTPLTTFEHDIFGNVTRQTALANGAGSANGSDYFPNAPDAANDQTTLFFYDSHGHSIREVDAEGTSTFFSYDNAGNVMKQWRTVTDVDAKMYQSTALYAYDRLGRQVSTAQVAASGGVMTEVPKVTPSVTIASITTTAVSFGVVDEAVEIDWGLMLPSGDIRITIDYALDFLDSGQIFTAGSTTQEWTQTQNLSRTTVTWRRQVGFDTLDHVTRVRAWNKIDGQWVEIADVPQSMFGKRVLSWEPPPGADVTASLKYRPLGSDEAWTEIVTTEASADISGLVDGSEYEYLIDFSRSADATAFVSQYGRFRNTLWSRATAIDRQAVHYNAFGEIDKKGVNDGWQEYFNYDRAGRLVNTNQGSGVAKTFYYDLQGNATVTVEGQKVVRTVYDAAGHAVEILPPAFTPVAALESIKDSFRVSVERLSYTFGSTVGDDGVGGASQIVDHRVDLKWGALDEWGAGAVKVQVDTNLGSQTRTFSAADARIGATIGWSESVNPTVPSGGPGADDAANAPLSSLTSISRVQVWKQIDGQWIQVVDRTAASNFGQRVSWDAPAVPGNVVTFRYRPLGSTDDAWVYGTVTLVGNRYVADLGDLPADRYDYEIAYRRPQEAVSYAESRGEFAVQGPPRPESTHIVASVEQPFLSVAARSTVGDEGKSAGSGTYTQRIDHRVDLTWASLEGWGAGDVTVIVNSNLAQQTRVLGANDAMTGAVVTWSTTFSSNNPDDYNNANAPRDNVSISSVEVWKDVAGTSVLVYQTGMSTDKRLLLGGATELPSTGGITLVPDSVDIQGVGQNIVRRAVTGLGGGMYAVDISDLTAGTYVYTPVYSPAAFDEASPGARFHPGTFEVHGVDTAGTPVVQEQSALIGIAFDSTVGDEGYVDNGNGTGSLYQRIDHRIAFSWDSLAGWGTGDVRVEFLTNLDTSVRTMTLSAADGMTGAIFDWYTDYASPSSSAYLTQFNTANGPMQAITSVSNVRVWKMVNGGWVEVHRTGFGAADDAAGRLNITNLSAAAENVTFAYRRAGSADSYQTKTAVKRAAGWFMLDDRDIDYGTYEYRLSVTQADGSPVDLSAVGGGADGRFDGLITITRTGKRLAQSLPAATTIEPQILHTFDRWGNVLSQSDPRNSAWVTEWRYGDRNQVIQQIQPVTDIWTEQGANLRDNANTNDDRPTTYYVYDINGNRVAAIDPNVNLQRWVYDEAGQLARELHSDSGVVEHDFDLFGREIGRLDAVGNLTTYRYDRNDRLTRELTATGEMTYAYDQNGNRISATNGESETTRYLYDGANRLIETRLPLWTPTGPGSRYFTANAYDALGRKIAETTGLGRQTWVYDYFGRVVTHTDLGGGVIAYQYDLAGQLQRQTRRGGVDFREDPFAVPLSTTQSYFYEKQDLRYEYYENGLVKRIVDAAQRTETYYEYDAAGNRTRERFASLLTGEVYQDVSMTYDELGRLARIQQSDNDLRYYYDANGNRRRTYASFYQDPATPSTQDYWYRYDGMNRIVLSRGVLQGNEIVITADTGSGATLSKGQGMELQYDAAGNRKLARFYEGNTTDGTAAIVEESYLYDSLNRLTTTNRAGVLTSARDYDLAGRVKEYTSYSSPGVVKERQVYTYNDNGWLLKQENYDGTTKLVTISYDSSNSYDALGRLKFYTVENHTGTLYTYYYSYEYLLVDGSRESAVSGGMTVYYPTGTVQSSGNTTSTYDVNGHVVKVVDQRGKDQTRDFVVNTEGQILQKREDGKTQHYYYANGHQVGSVGGLEDAAFDYNYTPVSDVYPASSPGSYVVSAGDTLQGISLAVYGDVSLWYLIADANGIQSDADLAAFVGQTLTIPNHVTNVHNNAGTFKVYDPKKIIGDTTPTIPTPPPPPPPMHGHGCGALQIILTIIVAVVAVVATVFTAGAAAEVLAPAGSAIGAAAAGASAAAGGGLAGTFAGGVAALSAAAGSIAGGGLAAVGGAAFLAGTAAVGSAITQGVSIAAGLQDKFSFAQLATAALSAAVAAPLASAAGGLAGAAAGRFGSTASTVAEGAVNGLVANAANQGINILTGQQKQFSWSSVAFAGIGAGATSYLGTTDIGKKLGVGLDPKSARRFSVGEIVGKTAVGTAKGAIVQAVTNHGRVDFASLAADSFGNALGNSIVGAAQWYGTTDGQKRDILLKRARNTLTQDQFAEFVHGISMHGNLANISPDDLEGILNDATVSRRLTAGDQRLADERLNASRDFHLTPLVDPNDKHSYVVPIVFDGTWNDFSKMLTDTNPGIYAKDLLPQEGLGKPIYENGPGTGSEGKLIGGGTGAGTKARENDAIGLLGQRIETIRAQDSDAKIILVGIGFSRGAAAVRDFANLVKDGVPVHDASGNQMLDTNFRFGALVLFDTVGSEGVPANNINLGFDFEIPDNVEHVLHIQALDERRIAFESIGVSPASSTGDSDRAKRFIEFGLSGAHSDIGGSYANPYSYYALDISYNFLQQLGVPLNPLTTNRYDYDVTHYSPDSLRLHDSNSVFDDLLHLGGLRTERVYYDPR